VTNRRGKETSKKREFLRAKKATEAVGKLCTHRPSSHRFSEKKEARGECGGNTAKAGERGIGGSGRGDQGQKFRRKNRGDSGAENAQTTRQIKTSTNGRKPATSACRILGRGGQDAAQKSRKGPSKKRGAGKTVWGASTTNLRKGGLLKWRRAKGSSEEKKASEKKSA